MNQFSGLMKDFFDKAVDTSKTVANKASEVYHDEAVRQSVRQIGHKVFDATKELGTKVVTETKSIKETVSTNVREKGFVNYSKELGARALDKTIDVSFQVIDFTVSTATEVKQQTQEKGVLTYTKELAGKGVDKAKQGYSDTVKYVKSQKDVILNPKPVENNVIAIDEDSGRGFVVDSEKNMNEPENERGGYTPINRGFGSENL